MQTQTNEVQRAAVNKALVYLKSAGVDFAIIYNGQKFGELEIAKQKAKRAPRFDFAGMYNYKPAIQRLNEGDSVKIPVKEEHRIGLQGTICAAMTRLYGAGSYLTTATDGHVEVMRLVSDQLTA